jgi:hypothetical protein
MLKKDKKDLTVREHLKMIQSDGGKARWAKLTPEERSVQARILSARERLYRSLPEPGKEAARHFVLLCGSDQWPSLDSCHCE